MAVFLYYPFLQNIINSFMKIRNLGGSARGLNDPIYKNYLKILTDENVRMALKNTVIMIVVTLIGQVGIAIVLAMLVDNIHRGASFFRIVYFFPIVISATALGVLFNLIFQYDGGMLSQLVGGKGKLERALSINSDDDACYMAVCGILFYHTCNRA